MEKPNQRSKSPQKMMKSKSLDETSQQAIMKKLKVAFASMRLLTKKEQIANKNIIDDIRREKGQEGVSKFLRKTFGLD